MSEVRIPEIEVLEETDRRGLDLMSSEEVYAALKKHVDRYDANPSIPVEDSWPTISRFEEAYRSGY
ncbi:MAG: hypothetical protein EOO77_24730 [Oxalobacteraceae bacterium]|nr:MAG: hypothetical protein EOO77_24730 [Oxalobacteraceae bacterium]